MKNWLVQIPVGLEQGSPSSTMYTVHAFFGKFFPSISVDVPKSWETFREIYVLFVVIQIYYIVSHYTLMMYQFPPWNI